MKKCEYFCTALEYVHASMLSQLQSCPSLCDPMDCSLPGSSVHGILQARILEWVAMPSFRESSRLRDRTHVSYVSCIDRRVLYHQHHLIIPALEYKVVSSVTGFVFIYQGESILEKVKQTVQEVTRSELILITRDLKLHCCSCALLEK